MAAMTAMPLASGLRRPAAFTTSKCITPQRLAPRAGAIRCLAQPRQQQAQAHQQTGASAPAKQLEPDALLMMAAALTPMLLDVEPAVANPLLTGKTVSLVHPTVMLFLLGVSMYTGILGWNYRTSRLIPAEVKELKGQLPSDEEAKEKSPLQGQIKELEAKRKQLTKGDPRGKHYLWSSLLLGLGVTFSIIGPLNTYLRTGKLFPGPHLWAGASITILWGIASSMVTLFAVSRRKVPLMSRGNDTARSVHIGANALTVALFLWQVPTGIEIVLKVFEFAPWP